MEDKFKQFAEKSYNKQLKLYEKNTKEDYKINKDKIIKFANSENKGKSKDEINKIVKDRIDKAEKYYKDLKDTLIKHFNNFKSLEGKEKFFNNIKQTYFNPGCVLTNIEEGNDEEIMKKFVKSMIQKEPKMKLFYKRNFDTLLKVRKESYNDQHKLLTDNIYWKLNNDKTKQKLKKVGAISYCNKYEYNLDTYVKGGTSEVLFESYFYKYLLYICYREWCYTYPFCNF
jgi:hypothetical protein